MNIYARLAKARTEFHQHKLMKSGRNSHMGYKYFELADFLLPAMECLNKQDLVPVISFGQDQATMTVYSTTDDQALQLTSPMSRAALKAAHEVQNLGAVQTYLRRYLWVTLMELVEHDALDSAPPAETTINKQQAADLIVLLDKLNDDDRKQADEWILNTYGNPSSIPQTHFEVIRRRLEGKTNAA